MRYPPGFEFVRKGRLAMLVRRDVSPWMEPILGAADRSWEGYAIRQLEGGRNNAVVIQPLNNEGEVVIRACRRRGMLASLWGENYLGLSPRPFREVNHMERLRHLGAPVVEVYGAVVRWLGPACYKGWLATRYVSDARTFWAWALDAPHGREREAALREVGRALRCLHRCGGRHPDLNLHNILMTSSLSSSRAPGVFFLDFDHPLLSKLLRRWVGSDLTQLRRSAKRLNQTGAYLTPADLSILEAGYFEDGQGDIGPK